MLNSIDQYRHGRRCANIGSHYRGIAQKPSPLWPRERGASETRAEFFIGCDGEHFNQIESWTNARLRMELGPSGIRGEAIKRAYVLADITPEDPLAHRRSKLSWNGAFVFDRQIRDALSRVQYIWSGKGVRRTGVNAAPARTAADFDLTVVGRKIEVEKDLRKKEPRALSWLEEIGVLAKEAESRSRGNGSLEERHRVDKTSGVDLAPCEMFNSAGERLESRLYHVVIIESPRISSNATETMVVLELRRVDAVINGQGYQRLGIRHQRTRVTVEMGSPAHIVHIGGVTLLTPFVKRDLVAFERLD